MVAQTEEESKNRGDRTNSKFVYNLNPLCPNSESEIAKPGAATAHDSPTQEGANVDTPTGDGAVLTAAATHADGTQITTASNADTIAKGAVRGDEQHAEVTLSATVPTGTGIFLAQRKERSHEPKRVKWIKVLAPQPTLRLRSFLK